METITSRSNALIKKVRSLQTKKGRDCCHAYLVEGEKMILEAYASGIIPETLLIEEGFTPSHRITELFSLTECVRLSSSVMESLCSTVAPQGIAAVLPINAPVTPVLHGFTVALDGLSDPGNVGTIIRTADAVGASAVILSKQCVDLYSPKVIRSTMGSVFHLPVYTDADLPALFQNSDAEIIVSALDGAPFEDYSPPTQRPVVLVIGNEAHGVSPEVMAMGTAKLKIRMRGQAESFNAAVAAGIMMYQLTEKNNKE